MNKKEREVDEQLVKLGYPKLNELSKGEAQPEDGDGAGVTNAEAVSAVRAADYRYLTNMPIRNLTFEEKTKLEKEARVLKERIDSLQAMPVHHLWRKELEEFRKAWEGHRAVVEEGYLRQDGDRGHQKEVM
jgi:hypothetical protein